MTELLGYVLSGLVTGAVFALMASGLTLSYSATGVFNFAHGAVGFLTALIFFELTAGLGWPVWVSGPVAIVLVAPLLGYLLHRLMFRGLAAAGETAQIVATIGLTIALRRRSGCGRWTCWSRRSARICRRSPRARRRAGSGRGRCTPGIRSAGWASTPTR